MSQESLGQFVRRDPWLFAGSVVPPGGLLVFSIVQQHHAENLQAGVIGLTQTFAANALSTLAIIMAVAAGWVVSPKVPKLKGWVRLGLGFGLGATFVALAIAVFVYVG